MPILPGAALNPDPEAEMRSVPPLLLYVPVRGNPWLPLVAITSLAPNRLFGWGFFFFWAAPAWPTESIEAITSITTATSIASPKNAFAFAVNTLLSGLTSMFFLLLFFIGWAPDSPR